MRLLAPFYCAHMCKLAVVRFVWNLRQMGFPLREVAQAFLGFPFPLPFLRGGSDLCGRLAGRWGCLGLSWARFGAGMALEILGRSIRSKWISMRPEGVMQKLYDCAPNLAIGVQEFRLSVNALRSMRTNNSLDPSPQ